MKKLHNWQKNVPWLSHYEEVCRTNTFVAFEYREHENYEPPREEQPAVDTNHSHHEDEQRSYNPYLIAYHEETNTFTYNDPWVEIKHEDVCNSNINENYVNEQNSSLPTVTNEPAPTESHHHEEISPQQQPEVPQQEQQSDLIYNNVSHDAADNSPQQQSSPTTVEKVVEHVTEEVSCLDRSLSLLPPAIL